MTLKPWSHHIRATADGERLLARRLVDETRLPHETAKLFATGRIDRQDLEAVVRAGARHFVMDMQGYEYAYFQAQFGKEIFPSTVPHPTKEIVAQQVGEILLQAIDAHMKGLEPDFSWGQLLSRGKTLYGTDKNGKPIDAHPAITTALADAITWFDFDHGAPEYIGPEKGVQRQHALVMKLAGQGFLAKDKLDFISHSPKCSASNRVSYAEQRDGIPPLPGESLDVTSRRHARQLYELIPEAATPEAHDALMTLYEELVTRMNEWEKLTGMKQGTAEMDAAYRLFVQKLPQRMEEAQNPAPVQKKGFWSGFGGKKNERYTRHPLVLEGAYDASPIPARESKAPTSADNEEKLMLGVASNLAAELSRINDLPRLKQYEAGAQASSMKMAPLNVQLFVATRILSGHDVDTELKQDRMKPNYASAMRSAYCVAGACKPLFATRALVQADNGFAENAQRVIKGTRNYAPDAGRIKE